MKTIETKYHGPGERRGSRVSASDSDGNRVMLTWDNSINSEENHAGAALALCHKMGWHPDNGRAGSNGCHTLQGGHTKRGMVWCFIDTHNQIQISKP